MAKPKQKGMITTDDVDLPVDMPKSSRPQQMMQALRVVNVDVDQDESLTVEEALAKVAMILARTDSPKVLTEISDEEIRYCAALYVVADRTKNEMIAQFLLNFLLLRVSLKRQGRGELMRIAQAVREQPEQRFGRLRSLFGGQKM